MTRATNFPTALCGVLLVGLSASFLTAAQTPEETQAWEAQHQRAMAEAKAKTEALQRQRDARKADPMAWVRSLDPMTAGGWQFRGVANDGTWAAFSTEHQMKRTGTQVTVWLRQEYPEPQRGPNSESYMSNVEKVQYDCKKERARALLIIYYTGNNISGGQSSEEGDPKQAVWEAIVPGTQTESLYQWACAATKG